jgi:RNA polymerase sigma-54 factor
MGIQQKLHTKLVQKLILTPSLQQAIKLLPMSTLELSDLLNQEMVENPMLEEVPTEELQPLPPPKRTTRRKKPTRRIRGTIRITNISSATIWTMGIGRAHRRK